MSESSNKDPEEHAQEVPLLKRGDSEAEPRPVGMKHPDEEPLEEA